MENVLQFTFQGTRTHILSNENPFTVLSLQFILEFYLLQSFTFVVMVKLHGITFTTLNRRIFRQRQENFVENSFPSLAPDLMC